MDHAYKPMRWHDAASAQPPPIFHGTPLAKLRWLRKECFTHEIEFSIAENADQLEAKLSHATRVMRPRVVERSAEL